jgi:IS1 family transposase
MNKLDPKKQAQVVSALVEGNSIRATVRMTGVAKNTIAKLLIELGAACSEYMDKVMRDLPCKTIQVDEIWSFVGAKQKNVRIRENMPVTGDVWTWVAIDAETKLIPVFMVGNRGRQTADAFMMDLASRLEERIQLTTDGYQNSIRAVGRAFGQDVDYGVLYKKFANDPSNSPERRYSPAACIGAEKQTHIGNPDVAKISTSFVERQNLTMRMSMRRFTRLTNAFSKKIENHVAAIAIHQTLKVTPAMAAGVADQLWSIHDIVALIQ